MIHHTNCGMELFSDQIMADLLEDDLGTATFDGPLRRTRHIAAGMPPVISSSGIPSPIRGERASGCSAHSGAPAGAGRDPDLRLPLRHAHRPARRGQGGERSRSTHRQAETLTSPPEPSPRPPSPPCARWRTGRRSDRERGPAAAGRAGVGVLDLEVGAGQVLDEVELGRRSRTSATCRRRRPRRRRARPRTSPSSLLSSSANWYWKPEQPPPETLTRSLASALPSALRDARRCAARRWRSAAAGRDGPSISVMSHPQAEAQASASFFLFGQRASIVKPPDARACRRTDRMPLCAFCLPPGGQPGPGGRGARERPAQRLPARPRPDRPLDPVPPARVQDAGVRQLRGRPFPHPADPLAGGGADRPRHGAGAARSTRTWPRRSPSRTTSATARSATPARRRSTRRWPGSAASTTTCRPSASSPGWSAATPRFDGLNLTVETLEGLVKHHGPVTGALPAAGGRAPAGRRGWRCDRSRRWRRRSPPIADDVAYTNHDLDDGLRAGFLALDELAGVPLAGAALAEVDRRHPGLEPPRRVHETIRRLIDGMVRDLVEERAAAPGRARAAQPGRRPRGRGGRSSPSRPRSPPAWPSCASSCASASIATTRSTACR